jgi:hypothetical protein
VGIPELFETLTDAVWAEASVKPARNIGSVRRDLQRLQLDALTRMVVSPTPGTPEDARAVARVTLLDLATRLDRALHNNRSLDPYTRAHLLDSRERIDQALDARLIQTAASAR